MKTFRISITQQSVPQLSAVTLQDFGLRVVTPSAPRPSNPFREEKKPEGTSTGEGPSQEEEDWV